MVNSRKVLPGWIKAEPKAICNALGTGGTQKGTMGALAGRRILTREPEMKLGSSPTPPYRMVFLTPSTLRSRETSMLQVWERFVPT